MQCFAYGGEGGVLSRTVKGLWVCPAFKPPGPACLPPSLMELPRRHPSGSQTETLFLGTQQMPVRACDMERWLDALQS